jgi:hypothetical protein
MTHLGTIEGVGRLIVDSDDTCEAEYRIRISQTGAAGLKSARGTLSADQSALWKAMNLRKARLRLEDGTEVEIIIERLGDPADIIVNDPIPGF